jgi:hypothetical protein
MHKLHALVDGAASSAVNVAIEGAQAAMEGAQALRHQMTMSSQEAAETIQARLSPRRAPLTPRAPR